MIRRKLVLLGLFASILLLAMKIYRIVSHSKILLPINELDELAENLQSETIVTSQKQRRTEIKKRKHSHHLESKNLLERKPFENEAQDISKSLLPKVPDGKKVFNLGEDNYENFINIYDFTCYKAGTNINDSYTEKKCVCLTNYEGEHCSFPQVILEGDLPKHYLREIKIRTKPRRIIVSFPFNMELELLNARISLTYDYVDAFLILESNYTGFGDRKPLFLYDTLRQGYFEKFSKKLIYVHLDHFPEDAVGKKNGNGWIADALFRNYMGEHGIIHQLKGYRHDDILLMHDADEIIIPEAMQFLKLHDNYPEPFGANLQWNIYGFFWQGHDPIWRIMCGVTMGFLSHVLNYKAYDVRSVVNVMMQKRSSELNAYLKSGRKVHNWRFGSEEYPAGWHCSWCGSAKTIRHKLLSAINADFPRWGDFPEKREIPFITSLIKSGTWFDEKTRFQKTNKNSRFYAPPYLLRKKLLYKYLLEND